MLTTSAALARHLGRRCTSMATLWRVQRTDARVYGFTSLDEDIVFDGIRYVAGSGISPSAISTKAGLQVDNLEAGGFLDSDAITETDLRLGLWDHAELRIFQVNYADLSAGALKLRRGWLGEVTLKDQKYTAEVRGLTAALNAVVGELMSPACMAELGDARCTQDLTDYTTTGSVTSVKSDRIFGTDLATSIVNLTPTTTGAPTSDYFGFLTWLTGANAGASMEVREYHVLGQISLQLPMSSGVLAGDTFSVVASCRKSREVCIAQFGNIVHFRGFPDLPGFDKILTSGGQ